MQLGSPFGIPCHLHSSMAVLFAGAAAYGFWVAGPVGAVAGVVSTLVLFVCVLLHELGHALAAKQYGIRTAHITLYPFGGAAAIENMPEDPMGEVAVAVAGPAVNVVLAALAGWGSAMTNDHVVFQGLFAINMSMAAFNMIPAFPMDGGRVLRALLAMRMSHIDASRIAVRVGTVFAWVFIAAAVLLRLPSLALVGIFLLVALRQEKEQLVNATWQEATGRPPPWNNTALRPPL